MDAADLRLVVRALTFVVEVGAPAASSFDPREFQEVQDLRDQLAAQPDPCPEAEGPDTRHQVKIQSYGHCILCGEKVGPDVSPIKVPVTVNDSPEAKARIEERFHTRPEED